MVLAAPRIGILLVASLAVGQTPLQLKVKEKVSVPGVSANLMIGPFACDSDESVFLRPYVGRTLPAEVLKVSADGRKITHLNVSSAPGFEHSQLSAVPAFAVSPEDDVYIATDKPPNNAYLLRFDKDGQYRSSIKLELEGTAAVTQLAVLSSASFFVAGTRIEAGANPVTPFAGLIDDNGRMVARIRFPRPKSKGSGGSSRSAHADKSRLEKLQNTLDTIDLSLAESGGDGRVYFVQHAPGGPAYVVSAGGEVLKEIVLDTPKEPGFELSDAKVAGGRLAIMYVGQPPPGGTSPIRIFVYDVQTGKKVATYFHQSFEIGTALACYSPHDTFTFISSDESGEMMLVRASAR